MRDGFIKVAAATPEIHVADCVFNADNILALCREANEQGVQAVGFPELCLTGYTCSDLFLHNTLLEGAKQQLVRIAQETAEMDMLILVGVPIVARGSLYNCAAVLHKGSILGLIPKRNIPNYTEFYEMRHFTEASADLCEEVEIGGEWVSLCPRTVFTCKDMPAFCVAAEICEDLWVANPPSSELAQAGATIIFNLSASDEVIGKAAYRRNLVKMQSGRGLCGYLYCDAGQG